MQKLNGHYGYFGVTQNYPSLAKLWNEVRTMWKRALARRSQRGLTWTRMQRLLRRFPLPSPRIVHRYGT